MRDFMAKVKQTIGTEPSDPKSQEFSDYVEKVLDYEVSNLLYEIINYCRLEFSKLIEILPSLKRRNKDKQATLK